MQEILHATKEIYLRDEVELEKADPSAQSYTSEPSDQLLSDPSSPTATFEKLYYRLLGACVPGSVREIAFARHWHVYSQDRGNVGEYVLHAGAYIFVLILE